jgi:polyisoprenyl-teichoic acid--peptidoglycan teichoic acid transferase
LSDRSSGDEPPRPHWYNPLGQSEPPEPRPPRRGKARERVRRRHEDREASEPRWSRQILLAAGLGILGIISCVLLVASRIASAPAATPSSVLNSSALNATGIPTSVPINIRAWDGKQRFTILVMGIDKRPGETGTGFRTDTIILLSVNPSTKSIGILSIPRDLFMPLPNLPDLQRINSVYVIGELQRPGAGPRLVMQTIQYNLGITVNSSVVVSFDTVINLIDSMGGIDINVPETINDPEYPDMNFGYDPLYIPAGQTHMDGSLALKYARTRHQGTDYDRANRQQQVILAMRQRALKPEVLTSLVGQAPAIWNQVSKGMITDMSLDQILSLGWYVKDIPTSSIQRATIDEKYIQAIPYQGDTALTPNRSTIGQLMSQVFGSDYSK